MSGSNYTFQSAFDPARSHPGISKTVLILTSYQQMSVLGSNFSHVIDNRARAYPVVDCLRRNARGTVDAGENGTLILLSNNYFTCTAAVDILNT